MFNIIKLFRDYSTVAATATPSQARDPDLTVERFCVVSEVPMDHARYSPKSSTDPMSAQHLQKFHGDRTPRGAFPCWRFTSEWMHHQCLHDPGQNLAPCRLPWVQIIHTAAPTRGSRFVGGARSTMEEPKRPRIQSVHHDNPIVGNMSLRDWESGRTLRDTDPRNGGCEAWELELPTPL